MEIPVLIEPIAGHGFVAKTGEPLPLRAEGATRDDALANLRRLVDQRLQAGAQVASLTIVPSSAGNPWVEFAGMFKDDPYFDEWQEAIAENRRQADEEPDVP